MFRTANRLLTISAIVLGVLSVVVAVDQLQAQPVRPTFPPRSAPAMNMPVRTQPQIGSGYVGNNASNSMNASNMMTSPNTNGMNYGSSYPPYGSMPNYGPYQNNWNGPMMPPNGFNNPWQNGNGFNGVPMGFNRNPMNANGWNGGNNFNRPPNGFGANNNAGIGFCGGFGGGFNAGAGVKGNMGGFNGNLGL